MKRVSYCLALTLGGLSPMLGVMAIDAALQPSAAVPGLNSLNEVLWASRLRDRDFHFRMGPLRYRHSSFPRCPCFTELPYAIAPKAYAPEAASDSPREVTSVYLTASAHPTFFVKVPVLSSDAHGQIYLEKADEEVTRNPKLYAAAFDLSGQEGIVGIQMPVEAPALEEGKSYKWRVALSCNTDINDNKVVAFLGGVVERVANITGTPEEQFDYYLEEGIWQDVTEVIAEDRFYNASPEADADWALLMEASGLEEDVTTPIVEIVEATLLIE